MILLKPVSLEFKSNAYLLIPLYGYIIKEKLEEDLLIFCYEAWVKHLREDGEK